MTKFSRKARLRRMRRYQAWKRKIIEDWKMRTIDALRRRMRRGYGFRAMPVHMDRIMR